MAGGLALLPPAATMAATAASETVSAPAQHAAPGPINRDQFRIASCPAGPACMTGVSCPAKLMCMAVGVADHSMLAERWNGRRWTRLHPPGSGGLTAVSCTSATACTAVGFGGKGGTLAERWNGHSWTIQPTPFPGGGAIPFQGVSCSSARACTAAGEWGYDPSTSAENTLAEHWNGTSWTVQPSPMGGPTGGADLTAVSCTSATACTAVGYAFQANGEEGFTGGGLALRWNGTTWAQQSLPIPAADPEHSLLTGVSCTAARSCVAVGIGEVGESLAFRWNGSKWVLSKTGSGQPMQAVSCTSARACTAVGGEQSAQPSNAVARHWNGTTWVRQAVARSKTSVLMGVSCSSATRCTAVGFRAAGTNRIALLAERWNGHTWRVQSLPSS